MQTFLPYSSFEESAKILDYRRAGKQRVECWQLLNLMIDPSKTGWKNHPAFKMWDGYDIALAKYGVAICKDWISRGYKDSLLDKFYAVLDNPPLNYPYNPSWLGDEKFHNSHKSNLLRKDPFYYGKFGWNVPNDLPYIWPVN